MTLWWDDVPEAWLILMEDTVTGETVMLNAAATYTYTPATDPENRVFLITAEREDAATDPQHRQSPGGLSARSSGGGCVAAPPDGSFFVILLMALGGILTRRGRA